MVFWLICLQSLTPQLWGAAALEPILAYMPGAAYRCQRGQYGLCFQKLWLWVLTCLVVLRGISSGSCLCFILLEHSQDLCGPLNGSCQKYLMTWRHLGLGMTGGQAAGRPKSLGRKRLRKEIHGWVKALKSSRETGETGRQDACPRFPVWLWSCMSGWFLGCVY